ncbi:hypothetical protein ACJMK2_028172 [Sinanodonta woodiana]|uniref:Fibronectin type-III domain-containing protein n=1 Tax=Sinanodonta woodiana TaxID=1069815 RepID=A0ABD3X8H7_SINWO
MSQSCLVMAAVGSNCTESNCTALSETCNRASNSCVCNTGYTEVSSICKAGLNYPCFSSADCYVAYAECQINASSTCQCKSGYSNESGVCRADLGSECALNGEPKCKDVNAQCSVRCECKVLFYNSSNICTKTSDLQVQNLTVTTVMETSLFVQWVNPVKYGDVSKYRVSWKRLNANDFLGTVEVSSASSSVNLVNNLTAAVAYIVTVTSYESSGINISASVQQATKPYKPDGISEGNFDLDNGFLNITWHYNGTITGIDIRFIVVLIDSKSLMTINGTEVTTNYVTFPSTGLKNGYRYNVNITARSEEYTSLAGQRNRVNSDVFIGSFKTAVKVPDPPSSVTCSNASDTYINLMWNASYISNGDILYYSITVNKTSPVSVIYNVNTTNADLQYTVMNLTAGSFYTFNVYTVNEAHQSNAYAVVIDCETTAPVADKPVNLSISNQKSRSALVTWEKPSTLSGVLYGYSLQIRTNGNCIQEMIRKCSNCQGNFPSLTPSGCSPINQSRSSSELSDLQTYDALGLSPDMNYLVTVSAITKPGRGLPNNTNLITLEEAPQKPYNVIVTNITARDANVSWNINGPRPGNTTYNIMLRAASSVPQRNFIVIGRFRLESP